MKKLALYIVTVTMLMAIAACKRDVYGNVFINRDPVTFFVHSNEGQPLENVSLKTEELDGFDHDLIVDGTHYAYTDSLGMVTGFRHCLQFLGWNRWHCSL